MASFYDPNDRYRRRSAKRITNIVVVFSLFATAFGFGFFAGGIRSQQNLYILQEEKRILNVERNNIQEEMTALRANAQTADVRLEQLKASYEAIVSDDGPLKNLVMILKKQIDEGIDPKRMETILLSSRPPQNCSDAESKRFVVITPVYSGPGSSVSVGNGAVVVSAKGESAQSQNGEKEAWFDQGQAVEVVFNVKGNDPVTKTGVLPLYHSVIAGGKEYRFTISSGAKSFAKVTYDFCDYP
ncbi:MAG: hypothetical protein ACRBDI_01710 [Alphaproteobacteria bacterium]